MADLPDLLLRDYDPRAVARAALDCRRRWTQERRTALYYALLPLVRLTIAQRPHPLWLAEDLTAESCALLWAFLTPRALPRRLDPDAGERGDHYYHRLVARCVTIALGRLPGRDGGPAEDPAAARALNYRTYGNLVDLDRQLFLDELPDAVVAEVRRRSRLGRHETDIVLRLIRRLIRLGWQDSALHPLRKVAETMFALPRARARFLADYAVVLARRCLYRHADYRDQFLSDAPAFVAVGADL
jgi:hypothetical protein